MSWILRNDDRMFRNGDQTMTWIRNPWWDGFWILSGLPVGMALMFLASDPTWLPVGLAERSLLSFFTVAVLLETGHNLSPIALAWLHGGFRRLMLGQPKKYILLPGMVFAVALGVGAATSL